ncbi:MAG TPA: cytochrome c oxidase subunit II [Bacteroidota bacterium]|nr:cytochrome c oxidase subunit II [Bacteroidota bacterium]
MMHGFPLFPPSASTAAPRVDALFTGLMVMTVFFSALIFFAIAFFAIRYREGSKANRDNPRSESMPLELTWMIVPLCISFGFYFWATTLYTQTHVAPPGAVDIYVVGKQWMWKIQHQQGNREINELHVPMGRPVRLIMTSQDVIHSFFIPAFRIKQDVLPGRYTTEWFQATKPGEYHLFCAQFCGTSHASMIGRVIVMEPAEYERWLAGAGTGPPMAGAGEELFQQFGCATCHQANNTGRGPALAGLSGSTVELEGGGTVVADREYIRESILDPAAKVVRGYKPVMPVFRGQLSPEQVAQLVEYVRSLGGPRVASKGGTQ